MVSMASIDILLDIITLSLPLPVISRLHMATGRKVSLAALFMLGAL